jgi:hypothetical protein
VISHQLGLVHFLWRSELDSIVLYSPLSAVLARITPFLILVAVSVVVALSARCDVRDQRRWVLACAAVIMAVLLGSPVYSPQYTVEFFGSAIAAIYLLSNMRLLTLLFCVLIQIQNPVLEGLPSRLRDPAVSLLFVVRDLVFACILWLLCREIWQQSADRPSLSVRERFAAAGVFNE